MILGLAKAPFGDDLLLKQVQIGVGAEDVVSAGGGEE